MANSNLRRNRGGGGGAGFLLGPAQNSFGDITGSLQDARDARDTYATANASWLAAYDADDDLHIRLLSTGGATFEQRLNGSWVVVAGLVQGDKGAPGTDGAPGGGAIENLGITLDGTGARAVNEFIATGVMMGDRGDMPYLAYRLNPNSAAMLWFSTDELYDVAEAAAGDTSTDGSAGPPLVARNRVRVPESAGSSISGSVDAGRTAANELLLSTTSANVDITVEFFRYVPTEQQPGGLSATEQAKFDGIEEGATADQTGAEIKAAYEGEGDTNAFTDALIAKLTAIPADATAVTIAQVLAQVLAGAGININRSVAGQITITATGGGGGGSNDGVVESAMFDETTQVVTLTTSLGGTVTLNLGGFITATELAAALGSYILADGSRAFTAPVAGVTPTADVHLTTKAYVDAAVAGTSPPVTTHTSYLASTAYANDMITPAEIAAGQSGAGNALAAVVWQGMLRLAFLRPASEGDFSAVYLYAMGARTTNNQIGAWTQLADEIDIGGEGHLVLLSNNPLAPPQGYTLIVEVI